MDGNAKRRDCAHLNVIWMLAVAFRALSDVKLRAATLETQLFHSTAFSFFKACLAVFISIGSLLRVGLQSSCSCLECRKGLGGSFHLRVPQDVVQLYRYMNESVQGRHLHSAG